MISHFRFINPYNISQVLWYIFEITSKVNQTNNEMSFCYSIYPGELYECAKHGAHSKEEKVVGETARKCFEKFVKKFCKGNSSKKNLFEWVENTLLIEQREYQLKDSITETFKAMYRDNNNEENVEKSQMELEAFEELLEKSDKKKHDLKSIKEKIMEYFKNDEDVQLIDDRYLITC